METQKLEHDQQTIGRYEVLLYDEEVILFSPLLDSARILKPTEALELLQWLQQHQGDFHRAMHENN